MFMIVVADLMLKEAPLANRTGDKVDIGFQRLSAEPVIIVNCRENPVAEMLSMVGVGPVPGFES